MSTAERLAESTAAFSALAPLDAKILEVCPDGSGRVEIPIAKVAQRIDLSLTATGTKRVVSLTLDNLREMAANLAKWPGPVPIHRDPHRSYGETAGPAEGFIESLTVRGDSLWAQIFLTSEVMREFVAGKWRGFSGDIGLNLKLPTAEMSGWSVYGGVLTNRPALDVNYRIAAEASISGEVGTLTISERPLATERSTGMELTLEQATVQLATATATLSARDATIATLSADLSNAKEDAKAERDKRVHLEAKLTEANDAVVKATALANRRESDAKDAEQEVAKLSQELRTVRSEVAKLEGEKTGAAVLRLCRDAVRRGAPPSFFGKDGIKTVEADPGAWYAARFASMQALEDFVNALPKTAALSAVSAGVRPADSDDSGPVMDADRKASLTRMNLDHELAACGTEAEVRAVLARRAAK